LLSDTEPGEHVRLTLSRGGTMTSHRWKDERGHVAAAPVLDDAVNDCGDVRNPAASNPDRDAGSRFQLPGKAALLHLTAGFLAHIRQPGIREGLTNDQET